MDEFFSNRDFPDGPRKLLSCAAELFSLYGYKGTSVRQIAEAAEVAIPMVYYYFDDKEDLYCELMYCVTEGIHVDLRHVLQNKSQFRDRLRGIALVYWKLLSDAPEALRLLYATLFRPQQSDLDVNLVDEHHRTRALTKRVFEDAVEEDKLIPRPGLSLSFINRYFLSTLHVHMMAQLTMEGNTDGPQLGREAFVSQIVECTLNGIAQ